MHLALFPCKQLLFTFRSSLFARLNQIIYDTMTMGKTKTQIATTPEAKLTVKIFLDKLNLKAKPANDNSRFFKDEDKRNKFLGVRMSDIFGLAKEFTQMPLEQTEKLLHSDYYEVRMGAVSIMDFQARDKKTTTERRKELFELYIRRHDRINNWDLVDRSAPYVVGGYLFDKPRTILYKLAKSKDPWERRTSIVATYYFIRQNEIDETFRIAKLLVHDKHELVNKAVGSWVREAGKRDRQKLLDFLNEYAATMPRVALRYAVEKLDKKTRDKYLKA
jgi:3-methyladenine DNA glycosylase AlkD